MRRRRVDFIVVGAQKAGTTALHGYLSKHPEICMALKKEVHFFDDEKIFSSKPAWRKYHRYFPMTERHRVSGEATPSYMYWADAPRRIWLYNRRAKLIVILRNPVARAYSHWSMELDRGGEVLPFLEAVHQEGERCRRELPRQSLKRSYVDRGYYMEQLRRIWRYFPKEQVLVLQSEELRNHPRSTLDRVAKFLNVSDFPEFEPITVKRRSYQPISEEARDYLQEVYGNEIREINRVLGVRLDTIQ